MYQDDVAISWRFDELVNRAGPLVYEMGFHEVGDLESELHDFSFAKPLIEIKKPELLDKEHFFRIIDTGFELVEKGKKYENYALR